MCVCRERERWIERERGGLENEAVGVFSRGVCVRERESEREREREMGREG